MDKNFQGGGPGGAPRAVDRSMVTPRGVPHQLAQSRAQVPVGVGEVLDGHRDDRLGAAGGRLAGGC